MWLLAEDGGSGQLGLSETDLASINSSMYLRTHHQAYNSLFVYRYIGSASWIFMLIDTCVMSPRVNKKSSKIQSTTNRSEYDFYRLYKPQNREKMKIRKFLVHSTEKANNQKGFASIIWFKIENTAYSRVFYMLTDTPMFTKTSVILRAVFIGIELFVGLLYLTEITLYVLKDLFQNTKDQYSSYPFFSLSFLSKILRINCIFKCILFYLRIY